MGWACPCESPCRLWSWWVWPTFCRCGDRGDGVLEGVEGVQPIFFFELDVLNKLEVVFFVAPVEAAVVFLEVALVVVDLDGVVVEVGFVLDALVVVVLLEVLLVLGVLLAKIETVWQYQS